MRLIDADVLREEHCKGCSPEIQESCKADPVCASMMWVVDAPTIDPESLRPTGEWIRLDAHKGMEDFKCSVCRSEAYVPTYMGNPMYAYCPNCGAKMKGGEG